VEDLDTMNKYLISKCLWKLEITSRRVLFLNVLENPHNNDCVSFLSSCLYKNSRKW
jgi:hypothetical protein